MPRILIFKTNLLKKIIHNILSGSKQTKYQSSCSIKNYSIVCSAGAVNLRLTNTQPQKNARHLYYCGCVSLLLRLRLNLKPLYAHSIYKGPQFDKMKFIEF